MSKAGVGKGVVGAISDDTVNKVKKVASDLGKGITEKARTGGLSSKVQSLKVAEEKALGQRPVKTKDLGNKSDLSFEEKTERALRGKTAGQLQTMTEKDYEKRTGKKLTGKDWNDAWQENQTYKRYEKVGVSPIYSHGRFSRDVKESEKKYGSRLTEDDKVYSTSKKRARRQY